MANETSERGIRSTVRWADPYPKKDDRELQGYATCVIDGKGWRVSPSGRTYCIGRVEILPDGTTITVADKPPDSAETNPSVVEDSDPKLNKGKTTNTKDVKAKNNNFGSGPGRPKKEFPEDLIKKMFKEKASMREISRKTGVPFSSVQRILAGQRVLV